MRNALGRPDTIPPPPPRGVASKISSKARPSEPGDITAPGSKVFQFCIRRRFSPEPIPSFRSEGTRFPRGCIISYRVDYTVYSCHAKSDDEKFTSVQAGPKLGSFWELYWIWGIAYAADWHNISQVHAKYSHIRVKWVECCVRSYSFFYYTRNLKVPTLPMFGVRRGGIQKKLNWCCGGVFVVPRCSARGVIKPIVVAK